MKEIIRTVAVALLCASGVASGQTQTPSTQPAPTAPSPQTPAPTTQPPTTQPPAAQQPTPPAPAPTSQPAVASPGVAPGATTPGTPPAVPRGIDVPADYVIGPEDVLDVIFWRDKDMSAQVSVRPDGRITLPLLNEVQASGLTPDQLRASVMSAAVKFVEEPNVTVVVKTINSRKVFVTGMVAKPGAYPLIAPTTVMQLLSMAGGIQEFADSKNIIVMRTENGRAMAYRFNYKEVVKRKNLKQNIELKPGDTVVVP